jgi:glycosyltransferase involved in cell wall biosynthesis
MTTNAPRATVVVPFQREGDLLRVQLAALSAQVGPADFEVVLVGSATDSPTLAIAQAWVATHSYARLEVSERSLLPGAARNLGAEFARSDLLVFCDADDEVSPTWLVAHLAACKGPDVSASGGPLDERKLNPPNVRRWRTEQVTDSLPEGWWYLPYAPSSNLAVRRTAFESLGGFDPHLRTLEDVDLCWRLLESDQRIVFSPLAVVAYRHRTHLTDSTAQAFWWGYGSVELVRRFQRPGPDGAASAPRLPSGSIAIKALARDLRAARALGLGPAVRRAGYLLGTLYGTMLRVRPRP